MSQSKPKFTEIDFSSVTKDGRAPLPITNLPVNALSDDTDPTREIRSLIEQLQQTARDARTQVKAAEDERDEMAVQLEHIRRQNEDLRAHFVEITSLIRERDTALQEAERQTRAAGETQSRLTASERTCQELRRQGEETSRQREELSRQRDDLNRRIDAVTHASQETNRCFNDAQRQMFSIRQARDSALASNHELMQKLGRSEDAVADLQYHLELLEKKVAEAGQSGPQVEALRAERDQAIQKWEAASAETEQTRAAIADLTARHSAAVEAGETHAVALAETRQKWEATTAEIEQLRISFADLTARHGAATEAGETQSSTLAEARQQVTVLMDERDSLGSELERQAKEIDLLRQRPDEEAQAAALELLRDEIHALQHECTTSELRVQVLSREVIDLRNQLQDRAEQLDTLQRTALQVSGKISQTEAQFETLNQEREVAHRMREEALTSLASAQKQIDKIIRDRDLVRQQSTENALALEAQVEALRAQLEAMEGAAGFEGSTGGANISELARLLETREFEKRELADRLEQQRTETIDLGAQLHAAQEQIKMLGASLGEARLQAKFGGRPGPGPLGKSAERDLPVPALAAVIHEPFASTETHDAIRSMRRCYQSFLKNPADVSHLNELHCQAHSFSERARTGGLVALHRLSSAFAGLAQELYHYPEQVNPGALRTVGQTIEFLTTLLKVKDLRQAKDPATALIYAVDDDEDNCDCIRMAMETAMMRTVSSSDPLRALCELADTPCDLIFLDVNLPGMDGFELCTEIRRLALHGTTPIIFLSGLTSAENRTQSSLSGGNEFVGKPFILCELTLKVLTLILKAELHLA